MGWFGDLFGGSQAKAAKKAAGIQYDAAMQGKDLATDWTKLSLDDLDAYLTKALSALDTGQAGATAGLDPYAKAGTNALTQLQAALGLSGQGASDNFLKNFQAGPGYQFAMDQGTKALDRSASASGGLYSGAAGKALTGYGQGLANQEFGSNLDRLSGIANSGQNAAGSIANILSQFAGQRSSALLGTGQARAGVRSGGLQAILDALYQGGAAQAGGVINAANAKSAGMGNLLSILGKIGGTIFGGGFGGGLSPGAFGASFGPGLT